MCVCVCRLILKSKFRELWLKGEKWIEARLKQDVGMLQEAQIIDIQGLGWARVYNVCNVRSVVDLQVLLSPQMTGLGVDSVEELCKGCNIDRKLIDLGHLILFNLQFLSHNLVHVNA